VLQWNGAMTKPFMPRVMLATDFSVPSMMAATAARQLVDAFGSQLTIAHSIRPEGPLSREEATEAIDVLREERFAGIEVQPVVVEGKQPAEAIAAAADEHRTSLIVMGRHGEHPLGDRWLGTTTERVARHAPCSVYVCHPARREQPVTTQHILLATDMSEHAAAPAAAAARLAKQFGAFVTIAHVYDVFPALELLQEPYSLHPDHSFEGIINDKLNDLAKSHFEGLPTATEVVRHKNTATGICDLASTREADLVVVGTHGLTGVARFLMGSVAERVLRHAPSSVMVVRD
jgi:nucleotide-binding universal stress UspA family protein